MVIVPGCQAQPCRAAVLVVAGALAPLAGSAVNVVVVIVVASSRIVVDPAASERYQMTWVLPGETPSGNDPAFTAMACPAVSVIAAVGLISVIPSGVW